MNCINFSKYTAKKTYCKGYFICNCRFSCSRAAICSEMDGLNAVAIHRQSTVKLLLWCLYADNRVFHSVSTVDVISFKHSLNQIKACQYQNMQHIILKKHRHKKHFFFSRVLTPIVHWRLYPWCEGTLTTHHKFKVYVNTNMYIILMSVLQRLFF